MRTWHCFRARRRVTSSASCREIVAVALCHGDTPVRLGPPRQSETTTLTNHADCVVGLRHLRTGSQFRNYCSKWRVDDRHLSARADLTVKIDDVERSHANATIACRTPDISLFRCAVNVNVAAVRVRVATFFAAQPDDTGDNRIASRRIYRHQFASPASIFENRSRRCGVPDFVRDLKFTQWCPKTSRSIAQPKFRSGNRVSSHKGTFFEQGQFLIVDANHDVMFGVARRGAGSEKNCERGNENMTREDFGVVSSRPTHD